MALVLTASVAPGTPGIVGETSLIVTVTATDPTAPLADDEQVTLQIWLKQSSQTWDLILPTTCTVPATAATATQLLALPLNTPAFDLRTRARRAASGGWSAFASLTYQPTPPALAITRPYGRQIPFRELLDGVARRLGFANGAALITTNPAKWAVATEAISSAHRYCLETWRWPEAMRDVTLTGLTNRLIPWTSIDGADYYEIWDRDPDTATGADARRIRPIEAGDTGLTLPEDVTSVFVRHSQRPTAFDPTLSTDLSAASFGQVIYHQPTGDMMQCIAADGAPISELADTAKWAARRILWILAEPIKLLTEATLLGSGQHERAQAADLRAQAEDMLNILARRETSTR